MRGSSPRTQIYDSFVIYVTSVTYVTWFHNVKINLGACSVVNCLIYMVLCSTDSHWPISLKVQAGNVVLHKTLRMLKFYHITAFMKT